MTIFNTAFETTMGSVLSTQKADAAVRAALITSGLGNKSLGVIPVGQINAGFITGANSDEASIPPLIHPYLVKNFRGKDYLITDVRIFRGANLREDYFSDTQFEESVRNKGEYNLIKSRTALTLSWLAKDQDKLKARLSFGGSVYAAWLSTSISRAYALDPLDQAKLTAISLYFYHTLFTEDGKLEGDRLETAVVHTIKTTKLPAKEVYELFDGLEEMYSIRDYCVQVVKVLDNIRLKDFNLAMLLTLVQQTWFGTNAKEYIQVALEHPPTWFSIVYATIMERTYKSSAIYRVIENQTRMNRGGSEEFVRNYALLVHGTIHTTEGIDNVAPGISPEDAQMMQAIQVSITEELADPEVDTNIPEQEAGGFTFPAFTD